jgi:hypothetical protein
MKDFEGASLHALGQSRSPGPQAQQPSAEQELRPGLARLRVQVGVASIRSLQLKGRDHAQAPRARRGFKCVGAPRAVDVGSFDCIFAELLGHMPLFPGEDYLEQVLRFGAVLATPNAQHMAFIGTSPL